MIRKKTGFKELTILVLASAALVSVACGDDDGTGDPGGTSGSSGTGTAGSSSTAGKNNGGSAGKNNGGSAGNGGTNNAGSGNGGTDAGGTDAGGTDAGGTGGSDPMGGEAGMGGVPTDGGMGGEGGEPVGGMGGDGGMGGEGGTAEPVFAVLMNPGFEAWLANQTWAPGDGTTVFPAWTNVSTPAGSSAIKWAEKHTGDVHLNQYNAAAFTANVEQQVSPIANGTYSFSMWVWRGNNDLLNESYLYAVGHDKNAPTTKVTMVTDAAKASSTYVKISLENIVVSSNSITVGVHTDAKAGGWLHLDDAELTRTSE